MSRLWVEMTDEWWEPIPDDPEHWRTVEPCDDTCHHPVHAFGAPRRRHIQDAAWIIANGTETKPDEDDGIDWAEVARLDEEIKADLDLDQRLRERP